MNRLVKRGLIGLLTIVLCVGLFGAGLVVGNTMPTVFAQTGSARPTNAPAEFPTQFDVFYQAWQIVQDKFVDRTALDATVLTYGAIKGMLQALGDEGHTAFLSPKDLEYQQSDISGTYKGIGARLGVRDGMPIIVAPFDGAPADLAGLKNGDIIMAVDGEDTAGMDLNDVVDRIRGVEGTTVTLTILRLDGDESDSFDVAITRQEIEVPAVDWAMVPGSEVALIRLSQFSANAEENLQTAIGAAQESGASAIILDLRNNPGGLLEQAVKVTSQFIASGNVLQEEDAQGRRRVYRVQRGGVAVEIPMVALINSGTASSAEILAGALQDYSRAKLIGETTFGTGTVLEPFMLKDGSAIMLGTRQWLTAKGRLIRNNGVEPDEAVKLKITTDLISAADLKEMDAATLLASDDLQFLKALELLDALPKAAATTD